jgi:hypothetical protein
MSTRVKAAPDRPFQLKLLLSAGELAAVRAVAAEHEKSVADTVRELVTEKYRQSVEAK